MYVILVYDIKSEDKGEKILSKVFKICKKYMTHIQNSVFEGELTAVQLYALECELKEHIRKDKDSVIVFKSKNSAWLDKEFIGKVDDKTSFFF